MPMRLPVPEARLGMPQVKQRISMVLVNDGPSADEGVVARIRAQPGFHVLASSAEMVEVLQKVRETRPDILLLNLRQDAENIVTLAGALHGEVPESRVILMGQEPLDADLVSLVRAGVSGFIMADASFDQFLGTIHLVAHGSQVLPSALAGSLFRQLTRHGGLAPARPRKTSDVKRLTGLEQKVADLIARGSSNREIATRLEMALGSVKSQVHRVLSKRAVKGRLEVAVFHQVGADPTAAPALPGFRSRGRN